MATTLAQLYWTAHVDANDVEFVLAPVPPSRGTTTVGAHSHSHHEDNHYLPQQQQQQQQIPTIPSAILGAHALWILDFDCCRAMAQDVRGVEQAVRAFCMNDPFFPRPRPSGRDDDGGEEEEEAEALQQLWMHFRRHFLETSRGIVGGDGRAGLPDLWLALVEERYAGGGGGGGDK